MTPYTEIQRRAATIRNLSMTIEQVLTEHGYVLTDTDIVQPADLFLTRAGDQLIARLFTFDNHGEISALRPEFTAAAARNYAMRMLPGSDAPIVRWQFHGPVFERAQSTGAVRQAFSIGVELIGDDSLQADVDVIVSAIDGLRRADAGLPTLVLGHVALMRALLKQFQLDSRTIRFLLNKLDDLSNPQRGKTAVLAALDQFFSVPHSDILPFKDADIVRYGVNEQSQALGGRTLDEIAHRLGQKRQRANQRERCQAAIDFLERWAAIRADVDTALASISMLTAKSDTEAQIAFNALCETVEQLVGRGVERDHIIIQPALERSWDYYTGIVFELRVGDHIVGGGGRYDELVRLLGAPVDVPAVGFALYVDVIASLIGGAASP